MRGIVSDENREPSDFRAIVSREKLTELRIALVGRRSSAASIRELLPGAASRKIGTWLSVMLAVPLKIRNVGVVTRNEPPHSFFSGGGTMKAAVSITTIDVPTDR